MEAMETKRTVAAKVATVVLVVETEAVTGATLVLTTRREPTVVRGNLVEVGEVAEVAAMVTPRQQEG
jgi:hypothetical protein